MKRVFIRPGKAVFVSDEILERARQALQAFGTTPEALEKLAAFKGDITIGVRRSLRATRSPAKASRRLTAKLKR